MQTHLSDKVRKDGPGGREDAPSEWERNVDTAPDDAVELEGRG